MCVVCVCVCMCACEPIHNTHFFQDTGWAFITQIRRERGTDRATMHPRMRGVSKISFLFVCVCVCVCEGVCVCVCVGQYE